MDNASLARQPIDNLSLATLTQQAPTHLMWIRLSPIAILMNSLIVVTVLSNKELRNRSHFIIVSHSISELAYSCAYLGTGIHRYPLYVYRTPYTANQFVCIIRQGPVFFGAALTQSCSAALAFDRLFCLLSPFWLANFKKSEWRHEMDFNVFVATAIYISLQPCFHLFCRR